MPHFDPQIESTHFGTVQRDLTRAASPITEVLFVQNDAWLPRVAELLAGDCDSAVKRNCLLRWIEEGQIRLGLNAACPPRPDAPPFWLDVQTIADDAACRVLLLPPVYLVHLA